MDGVDFEFEEFLISKAIGLSRRWTARFWRFCGREGERVSASAREPALVFADLSGYRVRAGVDERYVHRPQPGQKATIYGRNVGDREYRGQVVLVKQLMGNKTVFAHAANERKDLDAAQVLIDMAAGFAAPAGLRVDVAIEVEKSPE